MGGFLFFVFFGVVVVLLRGWGIVVITGRISWPFTGYSVDFTRVAS